MRQTDERQVCVVGLGYIGLPTASVLAAAGYRVVGVDLRQDVLESLRRGEPHIEEPDLRLLVQAGVASGRLSVADSPVASDVFLICVPTPLNEKRRAGLHYVESASTAIGKCLTPSNLVLLESTVPPGTTQGLVRSSLEEVSGLLAGRDFHLAYCPERVLPGRILLELVENDRVVGGVSPLCASVAAQFYRTFVRGEVLETNALTAEMVKIVENTYRDVNIGLANELALAAERVGVDVWEIIGLANRHPRVNVLRPGPGVGGHCIPIDPWFLVEAAGDGLALIPAARSVNDGMPGHVAALVAEASPPPGPVAILGLSYKADVDDVRESPTLSLVRDLGSRGYELRIHDPRVAPRIAPGIDNGVLEEAIAGAGVLVLMTDHSDFGTLSPDWVGARMLARVVIDARGFLDPEAWRSAGFVFYGLGRGGGR